MTWHGNRKLLSYCTCNDKFHLCWVVNIQFDSSWQLLPCWESNCLNCILGQYGMPTSFLQWMSADQQLVLSRNYVVHYHNTNFYPAVVENLCKMYHCGNKCSDERCHIKGSYYTLLTCAWHDVLSLIGDIMSCTSVPPPPPAPIFPLVIVAVKLQAS